MYCRHCGAKLLPDSAYCHRCGSTQGITRRKPVSPWLIVLLVLIGPIGWLALTGIAASQAASSVKLETRLLIAGFVFPPLWAPLIWTLQIGRWAKYSMMAGIIVANTFWLHQLTDGWTVPVIALVITFVLGLLWLPRVIPRVDDSERRRLDAMRRTIGIDLDNCHAMIAEIEDQLSISVAPTDSAIRRRYSHALEMRSEGTEVLRTAVTEDELVLARRLIMRAQDGLHVVHAAVTPELEEKGD
jgi:hypothetical protein